MIVISIPLNKLFLFYTRTGTKEPKQTKNIRKNTKKSKG